MPDAGGDSARLRMYVQTGDLLPDEVAEAIARIGIARALHEAYSSGFVDGVAETLDQLEQGSLIDLTDADVAAYVHRTRMRVGRERGMPDA